MVVVLTILLAKETSLLEENGMARLTLMELSQC